MSHGRLLVGLVACLSLAAGFAYAGGREMTDEELDAVKAGAFEVASTAPNHLSFAIDDVGGNRFTVDGTGDVTLSAIPIAVAEPTQTFVTNTVTSSVNVSDSAQQNLSALVNLNAANAVIQVLMNLNINVDSTVNNLSQTNLGGFR